MPAEEKASAGILDSAFRNPYSAFNVPLAEVLAHGHQATVCKTVQVGAIPARDSISNANSRVLDQSERRWNVLLPHGISSTSSRVTIAKSE